MRCHGILPLSTAWADDDLRVLDDRGCGDEQTTITVAFKKVAFKKPAVPPSSSSSTERTTPSVKRGNSLPESTFEALRDVSPCPRTIGRVAAAALVILHVEHGRTT